MLRRKLCRFEKSRQKLFRHTARACSAVVSSLFPLNPGITIQLARGEGGGGGGEKRGPSTSKKRWFRDDNARERRPKLHPEI